MIVASLVAMRMAEKGGYWLVMLITFIALPVRGLVAAVVIEAWGVFPVQALDGIGAGLQSVAVPGLVARILNGTGRVNVGQGAVMTVQGIGAALSPAIGGWIAQELGYPAAFLILGSFALGSLADLACVRARCCKPACAGRPIGDAPDRRCAGVASDPWPARRRSWVIAALATLGVIVAPVRLPEASGRSPARRSWSLGLLPLADARRPRRQGNRRLSVPDRHDAAVGDRAARRPVRLGGGTCGHTCEARRGACSCWSMRSARRHDVPVQRRHRRRADAGGVRRGGRSAQGRAAAAICSSAPSSPMRRASSCRSRTPPISCSTALTCRRSAHGWRASRCRRWSRSSRPTSCCGLSQRARLTSDVRRRRRRARLSPGGRWRAVGIVADRGRRCSAVSALDRAARAADLHPGVLTAVVVLLSSRTSPWPVLQGISWGVLPLVAGLFVLVEALEQTGLTAGARRRCCRTRAASSRRPGPPRAGVIVARLQPDEQPAGRPDRQHDGHAGAPPSRWSTRC